MSNYTPDKFISNNLSIIPIGAQKTPVGSWKKYQTEIISLDEARKAFNSDKVLGMGIICGEVSHGLECFDIDLKNDETGTLYQRLKKKVKDERLELFKKLVIVRTRNNGFHWVYRCTNIEGGKHLARRKATEDELAKDPNERVKVLLETRGEGQYFLTVPSNGYEVLQGDITNPPRITPEEKDYIHFTASSFNQYFELPKLKSRDQKYFDSEPDENDPLTAFSRNGNIIPYLEDAGWTKVEDTPEYITLKRPGDTDAKHSAYFFKDNKIFFVHSTSTTFEPEKGYNQAMVYAHLKCEDNFADARKELAEKGFGDMEEMRGSRTFIMECVKGGELGDAKLIEDRVRGKRLYDVTAKKWMFYDGGRWCYDEKNITRTEVIEEAIDIYKDLNRQLWSDLLNMPAPLKEEDPSLTEKREHLTKDRKALTEKINGLQQSKVSKNILSFAQELLAVQTNDFNENPYKINLANGTYDADKDLFYEHDPNDMISYQSPVYFKPQTDCPQWQRFLDMIFDSNKELIEYVQMSVGYSLTGLTDVQSLWFCYGDGANGKSTFFEAIKMLSGDYFHKIKIDALTTSKHTSSDASYHIAQLKSRRFVVTTEMPEHAKLNESEVKDLTGGETIKARQIYSAPITFNPTHKLWMFGNHKPIISGGDHGIWRRINLVPFEFQIPPSQRRPMTKVLDEFRNELSGILNWAIEGLQKYLLDKKIPLPNAVKDANEEYHAESDPLSLFLDQNIKKASGDSKIKLQDLFDIYKFWCERTGEFQAIRSTRKMADRLRNKNFVVENSTRNQIYVFGVTSIHN